MKYEEVFDGFSKLCFNNNQLYRIQMLNQQAYGSNDVRKKIQDYSYGLRDMIGRGFSSVVYRGTNDKTKEKVAIKVIDIRQIQGRPEKKMLEGEIEALKKLNHPCILKCHDIFSTANNCYIITEFCNEGDLQNLLKKREKLSEDEALPLIREFLMGFINIAESGFLHRDLKPANILLKDKSVKIADFGFAKRVSSNPIQTVNVGSPLYMSPQALQSNYYTIKNDIWSVGVILYEILHGKAPWNCVNEKQLIEEINKNNISMLKNLSQDLKDFIRKCLTPDQKKRISLPQLMNHPFIAKSNIDSGPLLLRKITSNNQNQQHASQPLIPIQNISNKPKILHHRNVQPITHEKQFLSHLNWMRFLNKYNLMFPQISQSGRYTLGLRFIVIKQLLCQLQALQLSLQGENIFCIEGWSQFLMNKDQKEKYLKSIEEYKKKYENHFRQLKEWIPIVGKDKRISGIADGNFQRSQFLSMEAIYYATEECKNIWQILEKQKNNLQGELQGRSQNEALRLDFTISYFQLNGYLIDNFSDSQYFARVCKLQLINEYKPCNLMVSNLVDLQYKLKSLQLIK